MATNGIVLCKLKMIAVEKKILTKRRQSGRSQCVHTVASSIASPICQEGQSERTFPIFAFSSRFFLFFPDFFPLFPDFWQIFHCQGWHSAPPPPPWLHHCVHTTHNLTQAQYPGNNARLIQSRISLTVLANHTRQGSVVPYICVGHRCSSVM